MTDETKRKKKDNLVRRAWTRVVCPLADAADGVSWTLFVVAAAAVLVSVVIYFSDPSTPLYGKYFAFFWYGVWFLFVCSTISPILNITHEANEAPLGLLIGVAIVHVLTFVGVCVYVLVRQDSMAGLTALMAAMAAAMMAGVGWVVQHQSSAKASRRAHTFGVLMQSRLSGEFQGQVRLRGVLYGAGNGVAAVDAPLVRKAGLKVAIDALNAELQERLRVARPENEEEIRKEFRLKRIEARRKARSLEGVAYLLNFYEFICAGIARQELDEQLICDTLGDIAVALFRDTTHLRAHLRTQQPKVYEHFDLLIGGWWQHGKRRVDG